MSVKIRDLNQLLTRVYNAVSYHHFNHHKIYSAGIDKSQ